MKTYIKPIQPTPELSGNDARIIVEEALTVPCKDDVSKKEKLFEECIKIFK